MRVAKMSWWAAVLCLGVTAVIWSGFFLMRFNPGQNPAGPVFARTLLIGLIVSAGTLIGAAVFSSIALIRPPRTMASWVVCALSWLILFLLTSLFLLTRMM